VCLGGSWAGVSAACEGGVPITRFEAAKPRSRSKIDASKAVSAAATRGGNISTGGGADAARL